MRSLPDAFPSLLPSLSRILQNLEARGLVIRRPVHRDQRRFEITLSPKGRTLFQATATQVEAAYAEITRRFGSARMEELKTLLDLLIRETERSEEPTSELQSLMRLSYAVL